MFSTFRGKTTKKNVRPKTDEGPAAKASSALRVSEQPCADKPSCDVSEALQ